MAELPGSGTPPVEEPPPAVPPPAEPVVIEPPVAAAEPPAPTVLLPGDPALDRGEPNPLAPVAAESHEAFLQDFSFPGGGHGMGSILTGQPPAGVAEEADAEDPPPVEPT